MNRRNFIKTSISAFVICSITFFFWKERQSFNSILKNIIKNNIPYLNISETELSKFSKAYLSNKGLGFALKVSNLYQTKNFTRPTIFEKDVCEKLLLSTNFFQNKNSNVKFRSLDINICGNPFAKIS